MPKPNVTVQTKIKEGKDRLKAFSVGRLRAFGQMSEGWDRDTHLSPRGKLSWVKVRVWSRILVDNVWAVNTPGNSFRELVPFIQVREVSVPLGRWLGSLEQSLCGHIPLARAGVLLHLHT